MRLTALQIAALAIIIEDTLKKYPEPEPTDCKGEAEKMPEMFPWEIELKQQIDGHNDLPTYDTIQKEHDEMLQFLVDYLS